MEINSLDIFKVTSRNVTPAFLVQLQQVEQVHPFAGAWNNLDVRLGETRNSLGNRAIFALRDPGDMNAALCSVQVAFRTGYHKPGSADTIEPIITCSDQLANTTSADTAVFYSISSWNIGNPAKPAHGAETIRLVAARIRNNRPQIRNLVTLSPASGLRSWTLSTLDQKFLDCFDGRHAISRTAKELKVGILDAGDAGKFHIDARAAEQKGHLHADIANLARLYLLYGHIEARKANQVAKFHSRNDAAVHRLCIGANPSPTGCQDSFGIMVNHAYWLDGRQPERNENKGLPCSRRFVAPLLIAA